MANLGIPRRWRSPIERIARLDVATAERLIEAMSSADALLPVQQYWRIAGEAVDGGDDLGSDGEQVVGALFSLVVQQRHRGWTTAQIADAVASSADLGLEEGERERLGDVLAELLALPSIASTAKAVDVMTDYEHVLTSVRLYTDMRPVFGDDGATEPSGAVIVTTMKLDHYTDGEMRSFYAAMDGNDLLALQAAVERAIEKTAALRAFVTSGGLPVYDTQRGDDAEA